MKAWVLKAVIDNLYRQGVGCSLRLDCQGGHTYEGVHSGVNADEGTILIRESTSLVSTQDVLVDIESVVAVTVLA